jgi:hypothetical protein
MHVIDEYMRVLLSQKSQRKERKVIRVMMVQAMLEMKTSLRGPENRHIAVAPKGR